MNTPLQAMEYGLKKAQIKMERCLSEYGYVKSSKRYEYQSLVNQSSDYMGAIRQWKKWKAEGWFK